MDQPPKGKKKEGGTIIQIPTQKEVAGKTPKQKCISCGKQFLTFLFSTIGLSVLMVAYTIFGAFIFMKLESPAEAQLRHNMNEKRNWHVDYLWKMTVEMNVFFKENWTREADSMLKNYTDEVYRAIELQGWDGIQSVDVQENRLWSFPASMLYSITVITTIGFGHITPKTMWGRVVTILYAIVGIPLTLLTITNLGGFMASAFRFIYRDICCGLFCRCCRSSNKKQTRQQPPPNPATKYKDIPNAGETAISLTAADAEVAAAEAGGCGSNGEAPGVNDQGNQASGHHPPIGSSALNWSHGVQRSLTTKDNETVSVPIYISLLLITGYILAGAMLFTFWEKDWNFFIGAYFCFITLTTIGFGDYVPGTSMDSWDSHQKLVLCALYLMMGLALIAMCFDLMQEEVRQGCRKLGRAMGIISDDGVSRKVKKGKKSRKKTSGSKRTHKSKRKKLKESKKDLNDKDKGSLVDISIKDADEDKVGVQIYGKKLSSADNLWLGSDNSPWIKRNVSWSEKDYHGHSRPDNGGSGQGSSCSTPKQGTSLDRRPHHIRKADVDRHQFPRRSGSDQPLTSGRMADTTPSTASSPRGGSERNLPQQPQSSQQLQQPQKEDSVVFTVDVTRDNPPMILTRYPAYNTDPEPTGVNPPTYHEVNS